MKKLIRLLIPFAIVTIIFGTIYGAVQQSLRLTANDPQIAVAQNVAAKLNAGMAPDKLVGDTVDLDKSLSTAVIISDTNGQPVFASAHLNGSIPTVPLGVLRASQGQSYHAITWQPQDDLRLASVSTSANGYYVTAVRSLEEVEKREEHAMQLVGVGWLMSVAGLGLATVVRPRK